MPFVLQIIRDRIIPTGRIRPDRPVSEEVRLHEAVHRAIIDLLLLLPADPHRQGGHHLHLLQAAVVQEEGKKVQSTHCY